MRSNASVDTPRFKCRRRAHVKATSKRLIEKARCLTAKGALFVTFAFVHRQHALNDAPGSVATTMLGTRNTRKARASP